MRWATTKLVRPCIIASNAVLNFGFGLHIHRTGAVVQDQDLGLGEQRAGDGDALLLSARQIDAALLDVGIVSVRQLQDEIVRLGRLGRGEISSSLASGRP